MSPYADVPVRPPSRPTRHTRQLPPRTGHALRPPDVEHYTPIFVTLGAASDPTSLTTVIEDFQMGLAKRSVEVA